MTSRSAGGEVGAKEHVTAEAGPGAPELAAHRPSLADKVAFLTTPTAYGLGTGEVTSFETHWSWLFLTANRVFKLKKPCRRPFMDLTRLAARRRNCHEEVRLNRRLTSGVYLRELALRQSPAGSLSLAEDGEVVDWLIEMQRLPAEAMLDMRLRNGDVTGNEVTQVAERLAAFYAEQRVDAGNCESYIGHLLAEAAENRRIMALPELGFDDTRTARILDLVDAHIWSVIPDIRARAADGYLVEGHGDLRPEHVCLTRPLQIFDCLEFDRSMRLLDPFDEVNYLGLECEFLGAGWVRPQLLAVLGDLLGGKPRPELMVGYGAFRATLRARICLAHLLDAEPMEPQRWRSEARAYLELAEEEVRKL